MGGVLEKRVALMEFSTLGRLERLSSKGRKWREESFASVRTRSAFSIIRHAHVCIDPAVGLNGRNWKVGVEDHHDTSKEGTSGSRA